MKGNRPNNSFGEAMPSIGSSIAIRRSGLIHLISAFKTCCAPNRVGQLLQANRRKGVRYRVGTQHKGALRRLSGTAMPAEARYSTTEKPAEASNDLALSAVNHLKCVASIIPVGWYRNLP